MTFVVDGTNGLTFNDATTQSSTATNASNISSGTLGKARLPTGSVLQVVEGSTGTETFTTSSTYVSTNLSASITPTSTTSKILIIVSATIYVSSSAQNVNATVYRGGTDIASAYSSGVLFFGDGPTGWAKCATTILDSPASTSSLTYFLYLKASSAGTNVGANRNTTRNSIILMEIAA